MESPKGNQLREIINQNYTNKFLYLSPLTQTQNKTRNKSFKSQKEKDYSLSPQISTMKNSLLNSMYIKKLEKNSTSISLSKIKINTQYDNKESIIYNKKFIQKGSYNILVAVRVRPLNQKEKMISVDETITVENKSTIILKDPSLYINPNNIRAKEKFLTFDYAFDKNETQLNIFNSTTKFLINGIVNGYNATVFAYGATGAGKTYTMLGNDDSPGIMPYTLKELFNEIKLYPERSYKIKLWYLEIYNENIRDLLVNDSENLELREDPIKGLFINGITEKETDSHEDILSLLKKGNKNRTTEETDANETSSRSHAILQILVSYKEKQNKDNLSNSIKFGKLSLIDLAGSERASLTGSKGIRLIEGGNINRSLLVLGNCINALCESNLKGNKPHIPYRDSKLTRLLKDSLGGNSRTVMIANVSPFVYNFDDTYNTLKYAERAKHIKTKINKNILSFNSQNLKNNYLNVIKKLQGKIIDLEKKLLFFGDNDKYLKRDFNSTPRSERKNESNFDDYKDEKIKKININLIKYNSRNENVKERDYNINTIKENKIEYEETSNINSFIEENEKISSFIEDYIEQSQAEVKIKQKIMGIQYDIYLLNNSIKEKESKNFNISEDKTKLKSYKKILEKNIICLNEISKKNESILLKYADSKNKDEEKEIKDNKIIVLNKSKEEEKFELNEYQKKFLFLISKMCKIQMENIEIKYNNALLKDEIDNKDKKIKNLEKQIEFRDIIIKEKMELDRNNTNDDMVDKKYKIILSEQQNTKFKSRLKNKHLTEKNSDKINIDNFKDKNIYKQNSTNLNTNTNENSTKGKINNKRKQFSFHPRNASFVKSKQIDTPERRNKELENSKTQSVIGNNNFNFNSSVVSQDKSNKLTIDVLSKDNDNAIGSKFNEIIKNFNTGEITLKNFGTINKIIKKKGSEILIEDNSHNDNKNGDKDEDSNDNDDFEDDTNNKTLKSVLNDIKLMNSNINSKLNIIEKNRKNQSITQIKPISRTMANTENINNYINNDNNNKKKNNIKSNKNNNKNKKNKKNENTFKSNNLKTNSNSVSNLNLITAHNENDNFQDEEKKNIKIKNNVNNDINLNSEFNQNIVISVNRNKKNNNKKFSLCSSLSSSIQLNTVNNQYDVKNLKIKSPLYNTNYISKKGLSSSSTKTINFSKVSKNVRTQRNNSLLSKSNIYKDEIRHNLRDNLVNKRNQNKYNKESLKEEKKEHQHISKNYSLENINEVNNNINVDKLINSNNQNKEKTKLQIFYSEHLNKNKNDIKSPKKIHKNISNLENLSKNSRSIVNNEYDSTLEQKTNHDTIDNRKKKSYIYDNKSKENNNKQIAKKLKSTEKKKK